MGISRTEVNSRRLLVAAPKQENQAKLANYVATLREQLEQLAEKRTPDGLPRSFTVPKVMVIDYSEKTIAAKLSAPLGAPKKSIDWRCYDWTKEHDVQEPQKPFHGSCSGESPEKEPEDPVTPKSGLRRRFAPTSSTSDTTQSCNGVDTSGPVKLDAAAQAHIEKHRKLQEDLMDEMVGLARQLKESTLAMSQSLQNTDKMLDSTEKAVEHSLASTNRVNVRATEIYSESSKTTCFTWLLIFAMTCIFIMVLFFICVI